MKQTIDRPFLTSIAIDGPSASGKSSLARATARSLGWIHADTGSLYRAVAYSLDRANLLGSNEPEICNYLRTKTIRYTVKEGSTRVLVDGEDITDLLRQEKIGKTASRVSQIPCVREQLYNIQREIACQGKVVMDGRDIGTVIMPEASLKIFLVSSPEVRADRRYLELVQKGMERKREEILADLLERDKNDKNRTLAPLLQAPDALVLDNSKMTIEESVQWILKKLPR
ncbi:MAG: (d)CMP kinase [Leptospirales bacterium]